MKELQVKACDFQLDVWRTGRIARHWPEYSASSLCNNAAQPTTQHATMPPRLNIAAFTRPIAFRPRPQVQWPTHSALRLAPSQYRLYSDSNKPPAADRSKREDAKPIEHVSEEAAAMAKTRGEEGPDLSQGTPIEDVRFSARHMNACMLTAD